MVFLRPLKWEGGKEERREEGCREGGKERQLSLTLQNNLLGYLHQRNES